MSAIKYCLDANVLIEAWNKHYSIDLCNGYWSILDRLAIEGRIFCTSEVRREVEAADDGLSKWARQRPHLFKDPNDAVFGMLQMIFDQPDHRRLVDSAKSRSVADPFVIAHAMAEGATVVTKEEMAPLIARRIKIPNVCAAMNVRWLDEFSFLREVGVRFSAAIGA